jgi:hypothetical protein
MITCEGGRFARVCYGDGEFLPKVDVLRRAREARSLHEVIRWSEIFDSVFSRIWNVRSDIGIRIASRTVNI